LHNENGVLINRTSSRNFATRTICAIVDSLSPFVVAEEIDATLPSISGLVLDPDDAPMAGVSVILSGSESRTTSTDSSGSFSFPNLIENGNYNVRPTSVGILFKEYSEDFVEVDDAIAAVFTGTEAEFSISGRVVNFNGDGIGGVDVIVEGDGFDVVATDADGNFTFSGLPADGSFRVRAENPIFSFQPSEIEIDPLVGDVSGIEFTGFAPTSAPVSITGRVLTPDGRGLRNAIVTMTDANGAVRTATTSSFGYYHFDGVAVGGSYVMGVNSRNYRFTPRVVQVFDTLTDVDFVGIE
jgi:hypothetical protein